MAVLIGSRALTYWYPKYRKPIDFDIVATEEELRWLIAHNNVTKDESVLSGFKHLMTVNGKPVEVEIVKPGASNSLLSELTYGPKINLSLLDGPHFAAKIADPAVLMAIKKSHLDFPIRWWKHIRDYHFLKSRELTLDERHLAFMNQRRDEVRTRWAEKHGNVAPNLNMSNEEFFGKSQHLIGRTYEHDDLHFSTCFYERPLYERLKDDQTKALCVKRLFDALAFDDRVKAVQEEAFAIALERKAIPNMNSGKDPMEGDAFRWAVMRICTTLTSGWFREFAQDNLPHVMKHNVDFVGKFVSYLDKKGAGK
jgi:hypothetical protein